MAGRHRNVRRSYDAVLLRGRRLRRRSRDGGAPEARAPWTSRRRRRRRGRPPSGAALGLVLGSAPARSSRSRRCVVVVIVGWYWIRACQADAQRRAYENYVTDVNSVVKQSDDIGAAARQRAARPDRDQEEADLHRLEPREAAGRGHRRARRKLHDTGRLRGLQSWLETTMHYRTQGLEGLTAALTTALSKSPVEVTDVAAGVERLPAASSRATSSTRTASSDPRRRRSRRRTSTGVSLSDSQFALHDQHERPDLPAPIALRAPRSNSSGSTTGRHRRRARRHAARQGRRRSRRTSS